MQGAAYRERSSQVGAISSNVRTSSLCQICSAIQTAIASPIYPLKPGLPWQLLIATRLAPHLGLSRDFLDSLPTPFHWRIETAEEAESVASGVHRMNETGVATGLRLGEEAKKAGNTAFAKKDRAGALKAYTTAIDHYIDALSQRPDVEDEKKAKTQLAICFGNRAATYLLPGQGVDPKAALESAKRSEQTDSSYEKSSVQTSITYGHSLFITNTTDTTDKQLPTSS
jgi:hypothetical protein